LELILIRFQLIEDQGLPLDLLKCEFELLQAPLDDGEIWVLVCKLGSLLVLYFLDGFYHLEEYLSYSGFEVEPLKLAWFTCHQREHFGVEVYVLAFALFLFHLQVHPRLWLLFFLSFHLFELFSCGILSSDLSQVLLINLMLL
jgi:hypothetical protein